MNLDAWVAALGAARVRVLAIRGLAGPVEATVSVRAYGPDPVSAVVVADLFTGIFPIPVS